MNFDAAFQRILKHEGGYVHHPSDPGAATNMGITEAVARRVGYKGAMQDLSVDLAKRIYLEEYWKSVRADELPDDVELHGRELYAQAEAGAFGAVAPFADR